MTILERLFKFFLPTLYRARQIRKERIRMIELEHEFELRELDLREKSLIRREESEAKWEERYERIRKARESSNNV